MLCVLCVPQRLVFYLTYSYNHEYATRDCTVPRTGTVYSRELIVNRHAEL